jgi:hypothetical protein
MNNPDHISESLESIFWVKILKFFDADPGWKKFRSKINIPDSRTCFLRTFLEHTYSATRPGSAVFLLVLLDRHLEDAVGQHLIIKMTKRSKSLQFVLL